MPYTPPSSRSPADSRPQTPRANSFSSENQIEQASQQKHIAKEQHPVENGIKKDVPLSAPSKTYLSKHRRSPPVLGANDIDAAEILRQSLAASAQPLAKKKPSSSRIKVDTSPSPPSEKIDQLEDCSASPSGSPPSSGDDEPDNSRGRFRDFANLAELQAAIRIIEQHREGSPDDGSTEENLRKARATLGLPNPRVNSAAKDTSNRRPLSDSARKISHSRSSTDASAFLDFPRNKFDSPGHSASVSDGDEDDGEDEPKTKPILIRKKSGELVRPALRAPSMRRRPSSMPGTPTYSKAVHFQDNSLEHVRHFLQVDRPIAVSAGSSPVETYDDDGEFPFGEAGAQLSPPFDWEIRLPNFPSSPASQFKAPVKVEKVFLSSDSRVLIGAIAVRNLAFHKAVVARFTLDYWKTTSEVLAEYNNDVRKKFANDGYDRFNFSVRLDDQANLESKTMFFCIRYSVNGSEFWDNNGSLNYQVDFSKKFKPQNGKNNRPVNSLPRSKPSFDFSPRMRPRSMPSFDDFTSSSAPFDFSTFPHPSTMVGESPIRFRNKPSPGFALPDLAGNPKPKTNGSQQAFSNRYDFGASLSAAIQASSKDTADRCMQTQIKATEEASPPQTQRARPEAVVVKPAISEAVKPSALVSEKPSVQSTSYHELLDKYCFVRSRPGRGTQIPTS